MGHGFGNLTKVRGLIYFKISPFEQRAFAGSLTKGVVRTLVRIRESIFIVTPPFIASYLIYKAVEFEHTKSKRKNPEDFRCDE